MAHRYLSALAIVGLVTIAAPACAQTNGYPYGRYPDREYGRAIERQAFDRGYREGLEQGRNDARHNRRFSYDRHGEWRDADNGYHRGDGNRDFYRANYRRGFEVGYRESFDRIGRYDRDDY